MSSDFLTKVCYCRTDELRPFLPFGLIRYRNTLTCALVAVCVASLYNYCMSVCLSLIVFVCCNVLCGE